MTDNPSPEHERQHGRLAELLDGLAAKQSEASVIGQLTLLIAAATLLLAAACLGGIIYLIQE